MMNEETYNHYVTLINKKYNYDFNNQRRYDLVMKLMAWSWNVGRNHTVEN
jgi:hypothetical protein